MKSKYKNKKEKKLLTISLLVSNRKDTIRKCMESIRPILEQLPSELIAIDTVGEKTDGLNHCVLDFRGYFLYNEHVATIRSCLVADRKGKI